MSALWCFDHPIAIAIKPLSLANANCLPDIHFLILRAADIELFLLRLTVLIDECHRGSVNRAFSRASALCIDHRALIDGRFMRIQIHIRLFNGSMKMNTQANVNNGIPIYRTSTFRFRLCQSAQTKGMEIISDTTASRSIKRGSIVARP